MPRKVGRYCNEWLKVGASRDACMHAIDRILRRSPGVHSSIGKSARGLHAPPRG